MDKLKAFSIFKLIVLLLIAVGIPAYILLWHRDILSGFQSYDDVVLYLRGYQGAGVLVFLLMQILQIVISVLPGEIFQFAAGSLFGFPLGLLLTVIGAMLGTTIVYFLAGFLGRDAVRLIAGEQRMQEYMEKLNSERAYIIVFLLYLIPGIPKDTLCYLAGISDLRFRPFLILSTAARIPGMCGSLLFGSMYMERNYSFMIGLAIVTGIIVLLCVVFRRRILTLADWIYERIR